MRTRTLADELLDAVDAGQEQRVRDLVVQATEQERRAAAKAIAAAYERYRFQHDAAAAARKQAALLAWLGTATARQVSSSFGLVERVVSADELHEVAAARGRTFVETLVRSVLRAGFPQHWTFVRRVVRDGVVPRPDDDRYVALMVQLAGGVYGEGAAEATYREVVGDPELLDEVWRIFEIDVGVLMANTRRWTTVLTRLADEGRLDRQRLLDASLDALMRDFRPTTVGWYAELHEALEPTRDERIARLDRYLALVSSPAPAAVKLALSALRTLEDVVPAVELASAAVAPLTQPKKNVAFETLGLLARAAKREPEARPVLLEAATHALGHERADVQEKALALLERHPDDVPRGSVLGLADAVSARLRPRVEALVGVALDESAVDDVRVDAGNEWPPPVHPGRENARAVAAPLEAVASVDELIELAAMLLAGQGSGDDAECFLDGASRLCATRPAGFERRTAGLLKQASAPSEWGFGHSGQSVIATVVQAWVGRGWRTGAQKPPKTVMGFVATRALGVAERVARGDARSLLGAPTHAGGWLDPEALAAREARVGRFRNRPDPADRLQAAVRARPSGTVTFTHLLQETKNEYGFPFTALAFRADARPSGLDELGDAIDELAARKSSYWWRREPWGGFDALGVRWSLTVLPGLPEVAFAGAAMCIADAELLEGGVYGHPQVVLERALVPTIPLGPEAWLAVGAGLLAKSPDAQRAATDVLVASIADGRLDPVAAGEALAWLAENGVGKSSRLARPLRDVGRVSALHGGQTMRLLGSFLARCSSTPHGLAAVLEAVLEHGTRVGYGIEEDGARTALRRIAGEVSRSSKLGRSASGLLELPVEGAGRARLIGAAVEAAVRPTGVAVAT